MSKINLTTAHTNREHSRTPCPTPQTYPHSQVQLDTPNGQPRQIHTCLRQNDQRRSAVASLSTRVWQIVVHKREIGTCFTDEDLADECTGGVPDLCKWMLVVSVGVCTGVWYSSNPHVRHHHSQNTRSRVRRHLHHLGHPCQRMRRYVG